MTEDEAIEALAAIDTSDGEVAHAQVDGILRGLLSDRVNDAVDAVIEAAPFWACA